MPQRAGLFRHYMTIQEASISRSAMGTEIKTWGTLAQVWAEIRPIRGGEAVEAQQDWSTVQCRIRIRHRTDVTPQMRIVYGSRLFEILAVTDPAERREILELTCTEQLDRITMVSGNIGDRKLDWSASETENTMYLGAV